MSQGLKRHIASFLLWLFISYTAGITLFYHSHVINGVTIVHSHPFNKDSGHTHTSIELDIIHQLNHFVSSSPTLPAFSMLFISLFAVLLVAVPTLTNYTTPYFGIYARRGPPTSCLNLI